jgi:hypothetical protein
MDNANNGVCLFGDPNYPPFAHIDAHVFSPKPGDPVTLQIAPSPNPPENATYNFSFVIEMLSH